MVDGRVLRVLDGGEADLETVGMLMGGSEADAGVAASGRTVTT
jgi:hypothetical protein